MVPYMLTSTARLVFWKVTEDSTRVNLGPTSSLVALARRRAPPGPGRAHWHSESESLPVAVAAVTGIIVHLG